MWKDLRRSSITKVTIAMAFLVGDNAVMGMLRPSAALLLGRAASVAVGADERSKAVDRLMQPSTAPGSPACAVAVVENGQLVHSAAYGLASIEHDVPLTTSSVFAISSTTTQFTGFAVQLLKSRGQLSLRDSIRNYVPQL